MIEIIFKKECYRLIGACFEVHNKLGNGFLEAVYQQALAVEMRNQNIAFKQEIGLDIYYKGVKLNKKYIADFICYQKIILELKAVEKLSVDHQTQILNYLKATNLKLGILINFGEKSLKYKRLVL